MEIKLEKVNFVYQKGTPLEKPIIKNMTLSIEEGKIIGIVGKSGSGKTTLVSLMNGLLEPTSGMIKIGDTILDGKKKNLKELHRNVGFLFQFPEDQFFQDTVEKEIGFAVDSFQYRVSEKQKRIIEALYLVGLNESYLMRDPLTLSNGEMRRVALASILIYNPKILILDEPTVGMDEKGKKGFLKLLRLLKKRYHKTIILVTHDIEFLHKFVDQVIVLSNGKVVMQGNKYDVFKEEAKMKRYGVSVPQIIHFSNVVYERKKQKIGYRDEINDLIKDIYRYVGY